MWFLCLLGAVRLSLAHEVPQDTSGATASSHRFRAQKYALLLAYLALFPQKVHLREELVALFWPDAEDESAGRTCLRTALASLRRLLTAENPNGPADPFITPDRETIQLHPHALLTDVGQFERLLRRARATNMLPQQRRALLEKAVGLYKGPLIPGVDAPWLLEERARLESEYESAKAQLLALAQDTPIANRSLPIGARQTSFSIQVPVPISRYWGRETEREILREWLTDPGIRLITITGSGGMGKTRLAIEAARDIGTQTRCFNRVVFVPLAAYSDPSLLPEAVLAAFSLGTTDKDTETSAMEALVTLLRESLSEEDSRLLIVLDNFEHLMGSTADAAVRFIQALLASVSGVVLIVTSRRRLPISGERELPLSGLSIESSVALLMDRARGMGRPDWGSTSTGTAIREVVSALEGIPLALELIASWAALLSPRQVQERLQSRIGALFHSPLTVRLRGEGDPVRHHSLRAALDGGSDDLPLATQRFFVGMATVFRSGCTLPAVTAVLSELGDNEEDILYHLARLQDHSLLSVRADESEESTPRYHLLEVIREWAIERFATVAAPESELRSRHFHYFMTFVDQEAVRAGGPDSAIAFARVEAEEGNLLAALEYGLTEGTPDDLVIALDRAQRLRWCWWVRGRRTERALLRRLIPQTWERRHETLPTESTAYTELFLAAEPFFTDAVAEAQLNDLLSRSIKQEQWAQAALICERLAERLDNRNAETQTVADWMQQAANFREQGKDMVGLGYTLAHWAAFYTSRDRQEDALPLLYRCRELALAQGTVGQGNAAKIGIALASHALAVGNFAEAEALVQEAIAVFSERAETWNHADAIRLLVSILLAKGDSTTESVQPLLLQSHALFIQAKDEAQVANLAQLLGDLYP